MRPNTKNLLAAAFGQARRQSDSVETGREYVEAYVRHMHFIEGIHEIVRHGAADSHFAGKDDHGEKETAHAH